MTFTVDSGFSCMVEPVLGDYLFEKAEVVTWEQESNLHESYVMNHLPHEANVSSPKGKCMRQFLLS